MRFRAKLSDAIAMQQLTHVATTVAKLSKHCFVRLTPSTIRFVGAETSGASGGSTVWCELDPTSLCNEYRIEGQGDANEIELETIPGQLAHAMRSTQQKNAVSAKIQLTRKHTACLTISVGFSSAYESKAARVVCHDVPVTVMRRHRRQGNDDDDKNNDDVTSVPPDVSALFEFYLPKFRTFLGIVDRMKKLAKDVGLDVSRDGRMTLKIETLQVSLSAHFSDVDICDDDVDVETEARVQLNTGLLVQSLSALPGAPERVRCTIGSRGVRLRFVQEPSVVIDLFLPRVLH
ncbi:checkpoint protein HUS1-like [Oscarella lobularis]|uniref:checkpoint protein HUS1-like n=1 Tax=Oscarella lobularis TaxID=121494 RepID=UPI003314040A